ncbi:DUF3108 domain-containing protein [Candidatus Rariloculus sp.]|uniref:DUF3108 domain-containing protein n=1 Tax=Candidatus Rariloculus sp. TaxID=3101265 RepID=UPI003D13812E
MQRDFCHGLLTLAWLLPVAAVATLEAAEPSVATYTARYQVEYKGRNVGTAQFAVSYDDLSGIYSFSSRTRARGLLRLVTPRDVVERSNFIVEDGRITPLEFWYEDGSRKGKDNFHLVFDWDAGFVAVDGANGGVALQLSPGVLDRGAMQVALMRDIETNGHPGPYTLADENELRTYSFVMQEDDEISTPTGTFTARRFLEQRDGSSRTTLVWVAPELRYLPVAIEQYRDGELRARLTLQSVEGLESREGPE